MRGIPFLLFVALFCCFTSFHPLNAPPFFSYVVKPGSAEIRTYWQNAKGEPIQNLAALKEETAKGGKQLLFAMNCGMFTSAYRPVGLYIEKGKQYSALRKCSGGKVNFCLQPQGVFYIRKGGKAGISTASSFTSRDVVYATQSAPMVVVNGVQNKSLPKGLQLICNGVGIRKDGSVVLGLSAVPVHFHQFAQYFISQGCHTAMYFDGNVSAVYHRGTYFPSKGAFGAMIAVIK